MVLVTWLVIFKFLSIYVALLSLMLGEKEYQFLKDLDKDDITNYSESYRRVLKHRILKKQRDVIECALLINKLRDKLEAL